MYQHLSRQPGSGSLFFIKPSVDVGEGLASCKQSIVFKFNYSLLLFSIADPTLKENTYSIPYKTQENAQVVVASDVHKGARECKVAILNRENAYHFVARQATRIMPGPHKDFLKS